MKPEIADNPILSSAGLDKVEFIDYVGEDTTKYISKIWNEIQAA
jgi:hypothetical protein